MVAASICWTKVINATAINQVNTVLRIAQLSIVPTNNMKIIQQSWRLQTNQLSKRPGSLLTKWLLLSVQIVHTLSTKKFRTEI